VAILPDFYGPGAHGVLNSALASIGAGHPARWFSGLDTPREFVFVPDLFKPLVDLSEKEEAFGDRWIIAGAGGITARQIGAIAQAHLGRAAEFRPTARWKIALASLADTGSREFLPVAPIYARPAVFDDRKFRAAFGMHEVTPYERGVRATLDAIAGRAEGAGAG
jgi:nucleoside-diphosphate-sugar epimerase